jgi:hypothetical protein
MSYEEQKEHCENGCRFNRGWFIRIGHGIQKIKDPTDVHTNDAHYTPIPFIHCACASETKPFYIYQATARMLRILGCGKFEKANENRTRIVEESPVRIKYQRTPESPVQDTPDVKESDTWTRINNREAPQSGQVSGQVSRQSVQIDEYRDLSVVNVDRLPESVHDLIHPPKKRISGISIFKAEEFNSGYTFEQMKSDEVD